MTIFDVLNLIGGLCAQTPSAFADGVFVNILIFFRIT